jgi:cytochrome c-type biogenesis protein CcmE
MKILETPADRDCDGRHRGTVAWLAFSGYGANKSYYVTIAELGGMGDKAYHSQLRVEGSWCRARLSRTAPT